MSNAMPPALIPPGTYAAVPVSAVLAETSKGTPQVAVLFEFHEGDDPKGPPRTITWYGYLSDRAIARTVEGLRACGWTGTDVSDLSSIGATGEACSIVVEHEPDLQGVPRARVRWVNAGRRSPAVRGQMTPEKARHFSAALRGRIAALAPAVLTAPVVPAASAPRAVAAARGSGRRVTTSVRFSRGRRSVPLLRGPTSRRRREMPIMRGP